jgi:hypothetical protein
MTNKKLVDEVAKEVNEIFCSEEENVDICAGIVENAFENVYNEICMNVDYDGVKLDATEECHKKILDHAISLEAWRIIHCIVEGALEGCEKKEV